MAMVTLPEVGSSGAAVSNPNQSPFLNFDSEGNIIPGWIHTNGTTGKTGFFGTYADNGIIDRVPGTDQVVPGVSQTGVQGDVSSLDPTGYDQAQWEYQKQLELLAEQRAYNSAEAEKNRQWQERMSNTAYQRAVEDLEKAGLNKWLAITGGGNGASASTPSGSSASSSAGDASMPNPSIYRAMIEFTQSRI